MAKQKHIWELSKKNILKLRKEIKLNSLYLSDYENSFGIDRKEAYHYFDGYMDFIWDIAKEKLPKHLNDTDRLSMVFSDYDTKENLLAYHELYDRP